MGLDRTGIGQDGVLPSEDDFDRREFRALILDVRAGRLDRSCFGFTNAVSNFQMQIIFGTSVEGSKFTRAKLS